MGPKFGPLATNDHFKMSTKLVLDFWGAIDMYNNYFNRNLRTLI